MPLKIEDDEASQLAEKLASVTGESLATAVTLALRERLDRECKVRNQQRLLEEMIALGREIRAHIRQRPSLDHSWLYGEDGLPA
ncbi:MAG: type II toxin-antitoxin system VapB family antitoxin [Acetobacteraceae bacterium]|nr:type II toxin-antitoxin system VapB family antitoxin [Acetobacteraceae bacterium]